MSADEHDGRSTNRADSWVATTGRDAVNAAERLICGTGAVPTAARAEGFALAGGPAATLIDPEDSGRTTVAPFAGDTAWVHHRIGVGGPGARKGFAVELVASTAQEAVDHCLVAHRIARALSRPCLCTLDASIADEPDFARLPNADQIHSVLQAKPVEFRSPREEARLTFKDISALTGRESQPLLAEGTDDAEYLLVALGASRGPAFRIATELRANGVRCGAIGVVMVEPFPLDALSELVSGKRGIAVVHSGSDIAAAELSAWVRSTAAATPGISVSSVRVSGNSKRERTETLIALGIKAETASSVLPPDAPTPEQRRSVVLGIAPTSDWGESFLRRVAALLRNLGPVTVVRPQTPIDDTTTLAIVAGGADDVGAPQTDALDVLLAPDLATLRKSRGLESLRPGGTALLTSDPDRDPLSPTVLSPAQRAAFIVRDLRLFRMRRAADASPEPARHAPFDSLLMGALLAAAPGLGELVDRGDLHMSVGENETPDPQDAEWIRRGAAALEALDTAGLEAELEESTIERDAAPVPAQLVETTMPDDAGVSQTWSEALRHFHLTGEGAHSSAEPPQGMPLLPLALETLDARRSTAYPLVLDATHESAGADGPSVDLEPATLLRLYTELSRAARADLRRAFNDRARRLAWRMGEALGYPDAQGPGAPSASKLAGALGAVSGEFFDAETLSHMLPRAAAVDMPPARRERVERVWRTLQAFVERDTKAPEMIVVHPPGIPDGNDDSRVRLVAHEDGLRTAVGIFDSLALIDAVRAVRIAELEMRHAYDETIHDRLFERFDWQSFSLDELLLLPQVVVLVSGARLRGPSLAALSELLRSGRPVHVLVSEHLPELHGSKDDSLSGYHAGLGYLTVAHREAFVLQSSLGTPKHLVSGLRRMVTSLCPAVALVATPDWHAAVPPMLQLAAAHAGRATPAFLFDPSAGDTWPERFDLTGNPQVEKTWPVGSVRYLDADGREQTREEAMTFAHAVAVLASYRQHFRVIPASAVADRQTEIVEWLDLSEDQALRRLPFIWVQTGGGRMGRAVLTRELAFACRDRARTWCMFEELAGTADDTPAGEAPVETTEIATTAAASPVEIPQAQLEAANQAAVRAAMRRLVQSLVDPNGTPIPASTIPYFAKATEGRAIAASPAAAAAATAVLETAAAPAPAVEGPFIDTPLCTSCNECTNLNGRLFVYDENKQARIGDVSAGTFKQLVMAAEKCPARCIHPGSPRPGDASATKAFIARAAPFQ